MKRNPPERSPLRTESYGSVTVTWLDRAALLREARLAADFLTQEHSEVSGVLLFGSAARGDAVPGSDLDLLLILRRSDRPFLERIPHYTPDVPGIALQVLPYTEEEYLRLLEEERGILRDALAEGRWLVGPPERFARRLEVAAGSSLLQGPDVDRADRWGWSWSGAEGELVLEEDQGTEEEGAGESRTSKKGDEGA